jgi:hypothetical protein
MMTRERTRCNAAMSESGSNSVIRGWRAASRVLGHQAFDFHNRVRLAHLRRSHVVMHLRRSHVVMAEELPGLKEIQGVVARIDERSFRPPNWTGCLGSPTPATSSICCRRIITHSASLVHFMGPAATPPRAAGPLNCLSGPQRAVEARESMATIGSLGRRGRGLVARGG